MAKETEPERPKCCGECRLFIRRKDNPERGWCDNWAGVEIHSDYLCTPNLGRKRKGASGGTEQQKEANDGK